MNKFHNKISGILFFVSLLLFTIAVRMLLLYIPSADITKFFGAWYDQFIAVGRIDAFSEIFYNYSPPYLYLIDFMTLFRFIPKEISLKIIPIIFDFIGAFAIFKIVEIKYPKGFLRYVGFFIFLNAPTVFIESAMWGQADVVYTTFLLWSLYFILKEKAFYALIFFAVAVTFKLQALFFAPIFLILYLRKKFSFYLFFVIPVVFFISVIPAWLAGSPLGKLLTIYFAQFNQYNSLSMRAPNLYLFINGDNNFDTKVLIGLIVTAIIMVTYVVLRLRIWKDNSNNSLFYDIVFFTLLIPFLLPKMHDRYFFPGGIALIILGLHNRRLFSLALLSQASSLMAYIPYFTGWSDWFAIIGAIINCILIVAFLYFYYYYLKHLPKNDVIKTNVQINTV